MKSDDLLKQEFNSDALLESCVTDITEIKASEGKSCMYLLFLTAYSALEGAVIYSDRGTQYTSKAYRKVIRKHHIRQSMNQCQRTLP